LTYNYRYEYKKLQQSIQYREGKRQLLEVYVRYRAKSDVNWDDFESIHQRFESREYNYVLGSIFLEKLHGETWQKNNHISVVLNALASAQSVGITPTLSASAAPKL
jgi:homoserine dehydrogenase